MKRNLFFYGILAALALNSVTAQAQTARPGHVAPKPRRVVNGEGVKDGLHMEKGRVVLTELGVTNPITAEKKLLNGTIISTEGMVTTPDGSTTQMNEGDHVSLTGRVTTRSSIMEADSIAKIQLYDAKYPGKRKKAEAERERKAKAAARLKEKNEKLRAKRAK